MMKTAKEILIERHQYSSDNSKKMRILIECMEQYANQFKKERPDNLRAVCEHEFVTCDTNGITHDRMPVNDAVYAICQKCGYRP